MDKLSFFGIIWNSIWATVEFAFVVFAMIMGFWVTAAVAGLFTIMFVVFAVLSYRQLRVMEALNLELAAIDGELGAYEKIKNA